MAGRGRGNWNAGRPAHKIGGGSASGYSYFNKPHEQPGGSINQGWGEDQWSYRGYQAQQWSAGAGYDDYGYEDPYGTQMGWQTFHGGVDFSNGSGSHSGFHLGGGMNIADRKRPPEGRPSLLGRAPKRRQQDTNYYGGFSNSGRGPNYGGYGGPDADWMQGPTSSGWGMGAGDYYDENEYMRDLEYGGFGGGRRHHESNRSIWKSNREIVDHLEKWKRKQESPDDKLIYSKHRNLTQMDEKRNFLQAVRGVMSAMKCASETLSVEAKSESQVAELQQQAEQAVDKPTPQETDQTENESKIGTGNGKEENNKTEEDKDKSEEQSDKNEEANETGKEDEKTEQEGDKTVDDNNKKVTKDSSSCPRVLTGVVRVGPARRKLMVKDATDHGEEIVAVFKEKPRKQMLHRLASLIEFNLKGPLADKAIVSPNEATEMITVNLEKFDCKYPILISFTSDVYSDEIPETNTDSQNDGELLSEDKCRLALSKIRRLRWRKKVKEDLELPVVRIFMDFGRRLPGWSCMSSYASEVLVHTVMEKLAQDVRESEYSISRLFIQCIEVLAAGLILSGGPGLKDPCEAGSTDIFGSLKPQEAEDLTEAAQLALRMHACDQLKKLLDV